MAMPRSGALRLHKAPRSADDPYLGVQVLDDHGRWLSLDGRTGHRFFQKRIDRARDRAIRDEKRHHSAIDRDFRRAQRAVDAEEREADRGRRGYRRVRSKAMPERKIQQRKHQQQRQRSWAWSAQALPKMSGPIIDRHGEQGVFISFAYHGKGSTAGVAARVLLYGYDGAYVDEAGKVAFTTNFADSIEEAVCGIDHLEQINRSAGEAAKVVFHSIANVDHRLTPEQMLKVGILFGEQAYGQHGLPWFVALHPPPPDGDQRNWHLHIASSTRPFEHIGDHEWIASEQLRTDLDGPAHFRHLRELYADAMTAMSFEAGIRQRYTAKSHRERGLDIAPQIKLGEARTNMARSGRHVPANEENHERVLRAETAMVDAQLRRLEAGIAIQRDLEGEAAAMFVGRREPLTRPAIVSRADLPPVMPMIGETPPKPIENIGLPISRPATAIRPDIPAAFAVPPLLPRAVPIVRTVVLAMPLATRTIATAIPPIAKLQFDPRAVPAQRLRAATLPRTALPPGPSRSVPSVSRFADIAVPPLAIRAEPARLSRPAMGSRVWPVAVPPFVFDLPAAIAGASDPVAKVPARKAKAIVPAVIPSMPLIPSLAFAPDPATRNRLRHMKKKLAEQASSPVDTEQVGEQPLNPIERLVALDPWVRVPNKAPLAIDNDALAALGQDRAWLAEELVQHELRHIADSQERRIFAALDDLAWDGRHVTAGGDHAALNPTLARWARDDDFLAYLRQVAPKVDWDCGRDAGTAPATTLPPTAEYPAPDPKPLPEQRSPPRWPYDPGGSCGD